VQFSAQVFATYLVDPRFGLAALTTIWIAVLAQTCGMAIGLAAALSLVRGRAPLRALARLYVLVWRGTPLLAQLLLIYFGLPQLGLRLGVWEAGLIGLSLYAGAYMTEIARAALGAIDPGQNEAARSLGMSAGAALRIVLLPQAIRIMLPPVGNEFNSMLRTTSLLSVISVEELLRTTNLAINETFRSVELYAVAAVYYLAMTTVWTFVQAAIERRYAAGVGPLRTRAVGGA
jgi:polar amino acid transport system permease protein